MLHQMFVLHQDRLIVLTRSGFERRQNKRSTRTRGGCMGIDDDGGLLPGLRGGDGDGCIGGETGGSDGAVAGPAAEGLAEALADGLGEGDAEGLSEGDTAGDRLAAPSPVAAAQQ